MIWDANAVTKWLDAPAKARLKNLRERFAALKTFDETTTHEAFNAAMKELGIEKMVELAQPCRVALTGTTVSPGIFEVFSILGQDRVLRRFDHALKK